jgi:hypothetical protein
MNSRHLLALLESQAFSAAAAAASEMLLQEESPSVVQRSICQNSSALRRHKSCACNGWTGFDFKSIPLCIGLNLLTFSNLRTTG